MLNNSRMLAKGFVRNGHDVQQFSYREALMNLSPVPSKKWAARLAKGKTDRLLTELAKHYSPDMVLITAFKLLDADTVRQLRDAARGATFVCWYGDGPGAVDPRVQEVVRHCDWFLATSGGPLLQQFKEAGVSHCAFMPNPADADIEYPRPTDQRWRSEMLFTGKLSHSRHAREPIREGLIETLIARNKMTVWGCLRRPRLVGIDYLNAICGAKMVLSINITNNVRFYHSDRLIHCLACGAFVLAKAVPDSELLFADGAHLCYFDSVEQCLDLVDRYQADPVGRQKIARAGMARAHESFGCEKLARHIVDLVQEGQYLEDWAEVL